MPIFDPLHPQNGETADADFLRAQLNSLKGLIDAVPPPIPGPQGLEGPQGPEGRHVVNVYDDGSGRAIVQMSDGTTYGPFTVACGPPGPQGPQGPMGEATMGDIVNAMNNALANSSNNSNSVSILDMTVSDPPTQGEMQSIASRVDQLILALRR